MTTESLDSFLFQGRNPNAQKTKEDVFNILQSLTQVSCRSCGLSNLSPDNPGFLYRGNPLAKIAFLLDYPTDYDMKARKAFSDSYSQEFFKWCRSLGLSERDVFLTYVIQCKTPVLPSSDDEEGRSISKNELNICFPGRALCVLKNMQHLEVVVCLGQPAMKAILGGTPKMKSHQGTWFGVDTLPGVAVFCLPDPKTFDVTTSPRVRGRLRQVLEYFKTEYLGRPGVIDPGKIMGILKLQEAERFQPKEI